MFQLKESGIHNYCKTLVANAVFCKVANRKCAWIEYPIFDKTLADEFFLGEDSNNKEKFPKDRVTQLKDSEFVPTYEYCKDNGCIPVAVVDVACPYKGYISEIWEITNTNSLTKEKVRKIFNILGDDVNIYEIHVKDIMNGLNIHDPNLYDFLVKKAKKWTPKYTMQSKCEQWVENVLVNHKKYGYSIDMDACREFFKYYIDDFTNENDEKKVLRDVYRSGERIALVKENYVLCFDCGILYDIRKNEIQSNRCDKCLGKDQGYQEYIKKFREGYKKWGYDVSDKSHYMTYLYLVPPSSTAEYGHPICFECGVPDLYINKTTCRKCFNK